MLDPSNIYLPPFHQQLVDPSRMSDQDLHEKSPISLSHWISSTVFQDCFGISASVNISHFLVHVSPTSSIKLLEPLQTPWAPTLNPDSLLSGPIWITLAWSNFFFILLLPCTFNINSHTYSPNFCPYTLGNSYSYFHVSSICHSHTEPTLLHCLLAHGSSYRSCRK